MELAPEHADEATLHTLLHEEERNIQLCIVIIASYPVVLVN